MTDPDLTNAGGEPVGLREGHTDQFGRPKIVDASTRAATERGVLLKRNETQVA